jgi:hypothetical protein
MAIKRKALVSCGGVLVAHGFTEFTPEVGEQILDVAEDFDLEPGKWRWDGEAWASYEPPDAYKQKRAAAYSPIGDQLDALWHAMDQKILPMVSEFYEPLKAVKEQYPKP